MKKIKITAIAIISVLLFSCTAYAAISALSRRTIDPQNDVLLNNQDIVANTKENNEKTELEDIPVYTENSLMFETNGQYYLSRDACFYEGLNACPTSLRGILATYPTEAIRERDKDTIYLNYSTDTGYRLYLFSSYDNDLLTITGFPIIIYKELSHYDFSGLKIGDTIEAVEEIDSVAGLIEKEISDVWNLDPAGAAAHAKRGYPVTSVHYLVDGIIKIEYEMKEDRSLIISNIFYDENYNIVSANGKTINYRINELDLPY